MGNKIRGQLITVIDQKKFSFCYEYFTHFKEDYQSPSYCFDIWEEGKETEFKFSFILLIIEKSFDLKVIDMYATNEYYRGKGIARAIILASKGLFSKRIISSSNQHKMFSREMRMPDASRVWEKLEADGLAEYNLEGDYYFTV